MSTAGFASQPYSPIGGGHRGWQLRVSPDRHLLPVGFFFFLCSISRIAPSFIPSTANIFWGLAYLILIVSIVTHTGLYILLARRNGFMLLASVFATISALWSLTPTNSAYSGILLTLNVLVGFAIFYYVGLSRIVIFIFCYCFIILGLSVFLLIAGSHSAIDHLGNFVGLYLHKNNLAMHACILYFTGLLLFAARWHRVFAAAGVALAIIAVLQSRSGTALLMFVLVTGVLAICGVAAFVRRHSSLVIGLLLTALTVASVAGSTSDYDLMGGVLNALGKDSTLTGRTILWDQALKFCEEHPWFGIGYNSFWNSPDTTASYIWIITGQQLGSFHNIYLDRLVDVGAIGLALFVASILTLLWRAFRQFLGQRSAISAWPFVYTFYIAAVGLSEYPMFWNSNFQLLLSVMAAATCGVRTRRAS